MCLVVPRGLDADLKVTETLGFSVSGSRQSSEGGRHSQKTNSSRQWVFEGIKGLHKCIRKDGHVRLETGRSLGQSLSGRNVEAEG